MENFFEADLVFTARLAFRTSGGLSDELTGHVYRALEKTLEQVAADNGFLFDVARASITTREESVL